MKAMKSRIYGWMMAMGVVVGMMLTTTASAQFTVNSSGVLTKYTGSGGDVIIPDSINGQRITGIGPLAFGVWTEGYDTANVALTSVRIPAGVTHIDDYAFAECTNLSTVIFADSSRLQRIERNAFINCTALATILLPDSLQSIGNMAFFGCTALATVTLGSATASVGDMAFYRCPAIATLNSRSLTPPALGMDAFGGYGAVGGGLSFANCNLYVPETTGAAYSAANTWQNFSRLTADIPVGHDTIWRISYKDTTIVRIFYKDTTVFHYKDTTIYTDTLDTTYYNITYKDSIIYNRKDKDTTFYHYKDTDTVTYHHIISKDTIIYNPTYKDTIIYTNTFHRDSTIYHYHYDTVFAVLRYDTLRLKVPLYDTILTIIYDTVIMDTVRSHYNDTIWTYYYDTARTTINYYDTIRHTVHITDTALVPDTVFVYDVITETETVEVEVPVYIVIEGTGISTVVTADARAIETPEGILLEGLTVGTSFTVYSVSGALVLRANAPNSGTYLLRDLSPGAYLLWHAGRWAKFVHK